MAQGAQEVYTLSLFPVFSCCGAIVFGIHCGKEWKAFTINAKKVLLFPAVCLGMSATQICMIAKCVDVCGQP